MNILLTNSTPIYSGGELFVFEAARELKSRGHQVIVSAQPGHLLLQKCYTENIHTEPIRYDESIAGASTIGDVRRVLKKYSIDILHSNSNFDRTYGGLASLLSGISHVANIHSQHSISHNVVHWFRNRFATDHFLVDGEPTKKILVGKDHIPSDKISVLRLGIDVTKLHRDAAAREKIRRMHSIPSSALVIGNVGRLVSFKGHTYLIDAFAEMAKQYPMHLMLIGDGDLKNELEKQVLLKGIDSQVHFLGFRDDLPMIYAALDIYVHPSLDHGGESFPLAVLQALASGLPVVASRVGDIPLMLDNEKNGYLVPPGNTEDLKSKLQQLIESESERTMKGKRGAQFVRDRFTTAHMVDQIEDVYTRVLSTEKKQLTTHSTYFFHNESGGNTL